MSQPQVMLPLLQWLGWNSFGLTVRDDAEMFGLIKAGSLPTPTDEGGLCECVSYI